MPMVCIPMFNNAIPGWLWSASTHADFMLSFRWLKVLFCSESQRPFSSISKGGSLSLSSLTRLCCSFWQGSSLGLLKDQKVATCKYTLHATPDDVSEQSVYIYLITDHFSYFL